jgi:Flp pilus assembly protein TadG
MIKGQTFRRKVAPLIGRTRRDAADQRGSAILETTLSLVILLTFLFGITEAGFALYTYISISEASREGARFAIVRGATWGKNCATSTSSDCTASPTQIQSYVQSIAMPGATVGTPVYRAFTAGTTCPGTGPCNTWGNQVAVTVSYSFPMVIPFIPKRTFTMSSTSAMIIAQ